MRVRIVPALSFLFMIAVLGPRANAQFRTYGDSVARLSKNALIRQYQMDQEMRSTGASAPDLHIAASEQSIGGHKSGLLAGGLSLLIPGLGEYYVGDQVWRGAIFTSLEIGLWLERINFINRGDDSTLAFRAWADTLWSPDRYASFLNMELQQSGVSPIAYGYDFKSINRAEDTLSRLGYANLTHQLPNEDRQQYYELISKYIQFTPGWKDDVTHNPTASRYYQRHSEMRENMNEQYAVADYFLYGIFLNHILSAVDAVLLARDHNTTIRLQGGLKTGYYQDGTRGYIPTAEVALRF